MRVHRIVYLRVVLSAACLLVADQALCAYAPLPDSSSGVAHPGQEAVMKEHEGEAADLDATLFASPTTRDHVGRVVLPVMINGRGPFRFVVDTGANHSTISPRLVKELGLQPTASAAMLLQGITGSAQVSFVTVEQVSSGDFTTGETTLPVVWAPVMADADGIFGAAALSEKSLVVDFQHNRVAIARRVDSNLRADAIRIRAPRLTQGLVTVAARVDRIPVVAIIDTGSERTLGNTALHEALSKGRGPPAMALVTSVYGATEEVERGEIERAPPIHIDTLHIDDVAVVYGNFNIFKHWDLEDRPALIIGMDVLGTVASLGIDFKNEYVYLTSVRQTDRMLIGPGGNLGQSVQKR